MTHVCWYMVIKIKGLSVNPSSAISGIEISEEISHHKESSQSSEFEHLCILRLDA